MSGSFGLLDSGHEIARSEWPRPDERCTPCGGQIRASLYNIHTRGIGHEERPSTHFPSRVYKMFEQLASGNTKGGFALSRICCRMDWAIENRSHVDDVIEFESRVNDVWRQHNDAVICTYHLASLEATQ